MWSTTIPFEDLLQRGRWKVEYFCSPEKNAVESNNDSFVPIRSIVKERKETVDPTSLGEKIINYLSLEHIQSLTGELIGFKPRSARSVKSRCKIFREGDVLFGRLRPNLNKVWLVQGDLSEGLCSTEFLVLIPNQDRVRPMVLRYLLSSHYIQRHAQRLLTGTALPRMNLDDLLDIEIPLPNLEIQRQLEYELFEKFQEMVALRKQLNLMPTKILETFLSEVEKV